MWKKLFRRSSRREEAQIHEKGKTYAPEAFLFFRPAHSYEEGRRSQAGEIFRATCGRPQVMGRKRLARRCSIWRLGFWKNLGEEHGIGGSPAKACGNNSCDGIQPLATFGNWRHPRHLFP